MKNQVPEKQENLLISILANIVVPAILLGKGAKWIPEIAAWQWLVLALAFPCGYFFYDWARRKKINAISILGFAGTLLTGGVGLLQLAPIWVAVKEAAVPALVAIWLLAFPRGVEKFLLNPQFFDVERIEKLCAERASREQLSRDLKRCSLLLVASFVLSSVLNFALARWIVVTEPAENLEQFNAELGKMIALSWPIIVVPCMIFMGVAMWQFFCAVKRATGVPAEELFKGK